MHNLSLLALFATSLSASHAASPVAADPAIAFVASYTVGNGPNKTWNYELTVMNDDGSNRTVLLTRSTTSSFPPGFATPAWSPDLDGNPGNGYRGCLTVVIGETSGSNLYVMDVTVSGGVPQASNLRKIVDATTDPNVGNGVFHPEWSPDLDPATLGYQGKIAFIGSTDGGNTGSVNLVSMVWDGVTAQLVGPPSSSVVLYDGHPPTGPTFHPTWSPDGARIAVSEGPVIAVLDTATGSVTSMLSGFTSNPRDLQWSRTSSRVAVAMFDSNGATRLHTVDVDAGITSLVSVPVANSGVSRYPTWSPDDSSLAFMNVGSARKSKSDIVRMDLTTGVVTVLVGGQATGRDLSNGSPDWRRF